MNKSVFLILMCILFISTYSLEKIKIEREDAEVFTLINKNGDIEITGWNNNYILIEYGKNIDSILPSSTDINLDIKKGENIIIKAAFRNDYENIKVDFIVKLPKNFDLVELSTLNGNIEIYLLNGNVNAKGSNGNIIADNIGGIVNFITSNGDIQAYNIAIVENLKSTNGHIKASLDEIAEDGAEVATSNGDITLTIPVKLSSKLEVRGENNKINVESNSEKILNASTINGHVKVNIK